MRKEKNCRKNETKSKGSEKQQHKQPDNCFIIILLCWRDIKILVERKRAKTASKIKGKLLNLCVTYLNGAELPSKQKEKQ